MVRPKKIRRLIYVTKGDEILHGHELLRLKDYI